MSLYQEITTVAKSYLGPASEQFIAKQCKLFLKIEPEALTRQHLGELAKWVETGAARFLDTAQCKDLAGRIQRAG